MIKRLICSFLLLVCSVAGAQSIADKKASLLRGDGVDLGRDIQKLLDEVNADLFINKNHLHELYKQVSELYQQGAGTEAYGGLREEIVTVKENITSIENMWRQSVVDTGNDEGYALWHQPDTTIAQLVIDYGSQDYVYLFPTDIGSMKLSVNSNLPVPKESWSDMLEMILEQNGIGVRELNSFLRELFFLNGDQSHLVAITNDRHDLAVLPSSARICYVLSPQLPNPNTIVDFLEKFVRANTMLQIIGQDIFVVSRVSEIREILKIYDFIDANEGGIDYRLLTLTRVDAEDIAQILESIFHEPAELRGMGDRNMSRAGGLKVVPLRYTAHQAIFLFGTTNEIRHAEEIVETIENSVEGTQGKTIFTYICKHSDAEEVADVLSKTYSLLKEENVSSDVLKEEILPEENASLPVSPKKIVMGLDNTKSGKKSADNFIVDAKTGSIIFVVEKNFLPMLKDLIKKLDVPKKMVRIEVLLFEKKFYDQNQFGLNLLRIGGMASNVNSTWLGWATANVNRALDPTDSLSSRSGILDFFIGRAKRSSGEPAYDMAYKFLLTQQDITIHSNPSVLAVNQTTATINVVDEVSIAGDVTTDNVGKTRTSYSRNQYGTTIEITPTIHEGDEDDGFERESSITLDTNIVFDDPPASSTTSRPDITRRNIKNNVRIGNGQTVILGGLRRKQSQDDKEAIPFLGEIPGMGKLFSETSSSDKSTEMFVFITPKIVSESRDDIEKMQIEDLKWRPGDSPAFIEKLLDAKMYEKHRFFEGGMQMLLGRKKPKHERRDARQE